MHIHTNADTHSIESVNSGNICLDKRLEDAIGACCGSSKDACQDVHHPFQKASGVAYSMAHVGRVSTCWLLLRIF